VAHYDGVLFPLDAIGNWNLLYGARGFYQFQCVVPQATMEETTHEILARIAAARQGSFLTVLKTFGALESPGLLSFPMEGATIALDFPNKGRETLALLEDLDGIVTAAGGRIYPAKDGRMTGAAYRRQYSNWEVFTRHIDPQFSSNFWRRVMENPGAASA
jgi:L-gulonolactone oxidase